MNETDEIWLVDARGKVYEATLSELKSWISDGGVVGTDRVKRGNLRWLAVEKVPILRHLCESAFISADAGLTEITADEAESSNGDNCKMHPEVFAVFACDVCESKYCNSCPRSFAGRIKICPSCDSLCRPLNTPKASNVGAMNRPYRLKTEV